MDVPYYGEDIRTITHQRLIDILKRYNTSPNTVMLEGISDRFTHPHRVCDLMGVRNNEGIAELTGYEIKTNRGDWKNELRHPEKSEIFRSFCKRWFVVGPEGIIKEDEVPEGWGYLQVGHYADDNEDSFYSFECIVAPLDNLDYNIPDCVSLQFMFPSTNIASSRLRRNCYGR